MAFLSRITVYPIKSLDGISVSETRVLPGGSLMHDRAFAIVDEQGSFVNGKRDRRVHLLRAAYDLEGRGATLLAQGMDRPFRFGFEDDTQGLETCLSGFFKYRVRLRWNFTTGFPDDTEAWGPTVVGTATLEAVGSWFEGLTAEAVGRRFRANLEVGDVPAFWEDRLYGEKGVRFQVGRVQFEGINPCQRCVVPSRDARTGETTSGFQKRFAARREGTLPAWAARSRFDHFFRLCVNTRVPPSEAGKALRVGDLVEVGGR